MLGQRLFFVLVAGAFLLLQFADCITPATPDKQTTMQCCRTMPCTPANKTHDCCKTMISAPAPNMLPTARVSLNAPVVAAIEHSPTLDIPRFAPVAPVAVEAQQHSPPELYTLNVSLLI